MTDTNDSWLGAQTNYAEEAAAPRHKVDSGLLDDSAEYNVLDALQDELARQIDTKYEETSVPNRPNITIMYNPFSFDFDTYQAWVRKATNRKTGDIDMMAVTLTVLSHSCVEIRINGKGTGKTLADPKIHGMLGVPIGSTREAIRKMYGLDGHAIQAMKKVVEAAGLSVDGDVLSVDEESAPLV